MGEETDQYVESTSKLRDLVKGYTGFDIMDDENNFKDLYEIVLGIGQAWGDMEDIQKAALGEALGGKRNARGLYSIFDHLDTLTSAYETSVNSAGSAAREQEHYAESVQYSIDRTKASLQELSVDFLSSDLLKGLIEGANSFLKIIDQIVSGLGTVGTLLTGGGIASFVRAMTTGKGMVAGGIDVLARSLLGEQRTGTARTDLMSILLGAGSRSTANAGRELMEGVASGAASATNAFEPVWKNATRTLANVDGELVEVWFDAQNNVIHNMDNLSDIALRNGTAAGTAAATGFGSAYKTGVAGASAEAGAEMAAGAGAAGTEAGAAAATGFASVFNPLVIAAIAGLGLLIGKAIYNHVQNVQHKAASSATDKYNDRKEQVSGYKDRYESLYNDLHDSSKSEAERVQIREQILSLQQEITSAYGAEAAAVDLVNGELREQLDIMNGLVDKQIEKNNKDPNVQKGYADAKKAMTQPDKYDFGEILDGSKISEELRKEMEAIDGVTLADGMEGTGTKIIRFEGDATGAKKAAGEVQEVLDEMRQKYVDDDEVGAVIQHVNDTMIPESNRLNDLLDRHHANYMSALEQELTTQQRKDIDELGQAIKDVNTAAASGEGFEDAYDSYIEKLNRIKLDSKHQPVVDQLNEGLDDASIKAQNFYDILDGDDHIGKNNEFKQSADSIKQYSESLKELELEGIDVKEVLNDPLKSTNKGKNQILSLAKAFGVLGDDMKVNEGMVDSFITSLKNAGIVADSVADTIEGTAEGSFESFQSSIINDIANMDTINSALVNSFSGKGLTFAIDENTNKLVGDIDTIKNAYAELADEFDLSKLFERTANGVKVNIDEQRKLQSILESRNKQKFIDEENRLLREQASLEERIAGIQDTEMFADRYEKLSNELSSVQGELENVRNLKAAYEGATSAYQKYLDSQNLPSEGAIYENLRDTTIKRGDELLKSGFLGQEFRSIAQLFSYEDLSSAPVEEVSAAYTKGRDAVKGFFTENADGIVKFAEQVKKLDPAEYGFVTGSAEEGYNFFGINNDKLAEYFGVSVDIIDAMFGRFEQYGYKLTEFDAEQNATFRAIKANIDATQESFKDLDGDLEISVGGKKKSVSDVVNFDIAEIGNDADALRTKLNELNALKGLGPKIGTENLELVNSLIQEIIRNLQLIDDTNVEPGQVNLEGIEQGEREIQAFTEAFNKTKEKNKEYGLELTVEGNTQAMAAVDWFMSNPELAAAMKIDVSGGKESVIEQLTELAKNGGIQTTVDADVNTGDVKGAIENDISAASGEAIVDVDKGSVTSQTEEGIKGADGTTVVPEVDTTSVQSETESALNTATNKPYKAKVTVDNHSLSQQIRSAVGKSQPKSTKTTNETVTKETKETDIKTNVSGNAEADLAKLQAMASTPMDVKINVDTNADVAVAKLQSIAHTPLEGKVKISVEDSEVKSWKAPDKPGMVKYFVNGGNVSAWSPPEKQGYVRYNVTGTSPVYTWKAPEKTGIVRYSSVGPANGTAHWQGTAGGYYSPKRNGSVGNSFINHYNGTAYARGNWGLKRDEPNALINELGPEIVVRDGQWMIANSGFPTLADSPKGIPGGLQKGDIIFNHKQAEDILKHGYVTGTHARLVGGGAHANGSAFIGGSGPSLSKYTSGGGNTGGGGNTYISTPKVELKASNAQVKTEETEKVKETDKTLTGAGKLLPVSKNTEYIDLIEIKLNKLERTLDKIKTAAESAFNSFADRVSYTTQEINQLTTNINASKTAASAYQRQANKTITSGKYKLTDGEMKQAYNSGIADKGTYNTFANAKKAYKKNKSKSNKTALNNARKALRKQIRNTLNNGEFEIDSITYDSKAQQKYDKAKTAYDKKKTKKNEKALNKAKKALKNEKIKESLKEKISQYQNWRDKRVDMDEQAAELAEQRKQAYVNQFDIQKSFYDEEIRKLEQRNDLMNEWITLNENRGYMASTTAYEKLQSVTQSKINKLYTERGVLIEKLNTATKNGIAVGSEEYNNMKASIDDVTKSIAEQESEIADLAKKIRELNYEYFKFGQERMSEVAEEISFLTDIMSENPLFSGENKEFINEYGIATLGAYAIQMELAAQQAKDYGEQIKETQAAIARNDNTKENTEKLQELMSAQRQVIKTQYDMRKNIKSLVEDGFKKEIDSLKDIISEYQKMLDTQKSELDYSRKITEQQEKINSLRKQLASWQGDTSEEGAARRQKTEKDLRDAERDLQDMQEERRIAQTKEILTDLQDDYEKLLNERLDDISGIVEGILNSIGFFQGNIGETLNNVAKDSGITLDKQTQDLLKALSAEVKIPIGVVSDVNGTMSTATDILNQERENGAQLVSGLKVTNFTDMKDDVTSFVNGITTALTGDGSVKNAVGDMSSEIKDALIGPTGSLAATASQGFEDVVNAIHDSIEEDIKKQKDDANASAEVVDLLNQLKGSGSALGDKNAIAAARAAYNKLTPDQQRLVGSSALKNLTDSESRITALENAAAKKTTTTQKATATQSSPATNNAAAKIVASTNRLLNSSSSSGNGVASKIKSADEVRKFISAYASKATKKKGSYSDVNQVIYGLTGGKVLSTNELKDLAKRLGIKYDNASKSGSLYKKLKKLKATGFRAGTRRVKGQDYYWTQEGYGQNELIQRKSDGAMLTRLGAGDMVFNTDMTRTLWNFAKDPMQFMNTGGIKRHDVSSNINYGDSNIGITFNLPNVANAEDFMRDLQKNKKFEQIVQSMTLGRINGKGSLNKYNTRI